MIARAAERPWASSWGPIGTWFAEDVGKVLGAAEALRRTPPRRYPGALAMCATDPMRSAETPVSVGRGVGFVFLLKDCDEFLPNDRWDLVPKVDRARRGPVSPR
jgi:hypothetical protein